MKREKKLNITLLILGGILSFLLITNGSYTRETYDLKAGQVAPKTLYSPREMENRIASQNKKKNIADSMEPQYIKDNKIEEEGIEEINLLFNYVDAVQTKEVKNHNVEAVDILNDKSPITLPVEQYKQLIELPQNNLDNLKKIIIDTAEKTYTEDITIENKAKIMEDVEKSLEDTDLNLSYITLAHEILAGVIKPNMDIDKDATKQLAEETINKVEPVIILEGEKIIEQGTRVTDETHELLKDAGYLDKETIKNFKKYIGIFIIISLIITLLYFYMLQNKSKFKLTSKEKTLILVLYAIGILIVWLFSKASFIYIPLAITPMLISILINSEIAIVLNMILVIVGGLIYKADLSFITYFAITGIIGSMGVINIRHRNKILSIASYLGLGSAALIYAIRLFTQTTGGIPLFTEVVMAFLMGILMLIIVVGSLPLWEMLFDIVTPIKLLELTNPSQRLLRKLLLKAPGTYHHSLLVANLAEAAANNIGADSLLARVGGYYHDIGKMGYVNYYKENQLAENPHDDIAPELSAKIILSHAAKGIELADKYKLPKSVKDIIAQHHGDTLVQYFYVEACNLYGEENVNMDDFKYNGPKPQTKEAALVMLADVVEATVRSMVPLNKDQDLKVIVNKIVRDKLKSGQLNESDLLLKDIDEIINSFNIILVGMYHDRIKYPTKEEGIVK